jgi:hypothetical protein
MCLEAKWKKSTKSQYNGDCVEAKFDGEVGVRDSTNPSVELTFSANDWEVFINDLK